MTDLHLVALGCALGGMARHLVSGWVAGRAGERFPWGTLAVNVSGAFAIGIFAAGAHAVQGWFADPALWRLAVIGFLGSYTTVSSVSLQTLALVHEGRTWNAAGNVALSLGLCLPFAAIGLHAGAVLLGAV
jgi:fluoride exporter